MSVVNSTERKRQCPRLVDLPLVPNKKGWPWTEESPLLSQETAWPRLTIVTPSFNQGTFIEETIRSVLLQGYPNLEYIIIDGGSTDETLSIIQKYERWISYWISEPDSGQAHAINKGFDLSTGDVHAYINSDDFYAQGVFQTVGRFFLEAPNDFWAAFSVVDLHSDGTEVRMPAGDFDALYHWIYGNGMIPQPGAFWSGRIQKEVGGFDESMHFGFDKDFFLRLLISGYVYRCHPEIVSSFFRLHENSKTCSLGDRFEADFEAIRTKAQTLMTAQQKAELDKAVRHTTVVDLIRSSWQDDVASFHQSARKLIAAVKIEPSIILDRFFWGGSKRVIGKALRSTY